MTKHRGATVPATEWWRHLRDEARRFWKRDRAAGKAEAIDSQSQVHTTRWAQCDCCRHWFTPQGAMKQHLRPY